jgi:arylsulfatase A-like enzyme
MAVGWAVGAVCSTWPHRAEAAETAPRPNIVYIVSDDQGWNDVGFRSADLKTPNIDQLARGQATLAQQAPSPRNEIVYGIEPFRGAIRRGNGKLVRQATLPSSVELFDLAADPAEKNNLAAANPERVAELQRWIEAQARDAVPPLILQEALGAVKPALFGSVVFPAEVKAIQQQP